MRGLIGVRAGRDGLGVRVGVRFWFLFFIGLLGFCFERYFLFVFMILMRLFVFLELLLFRVSYLVFFGLFGELYCLVCT